MGNEQIPMGNNALSLHQSNGLIRLTRKLRPRRFHSDAPRFDTHALVARPPRLKPDNLVVA